MNRIIFLLILLGHFFSAKSQVAAWQFGSPASLGNEVTYNATTTAANTATSVLSRGAGIAASALGRGFSANNFNVSGTKAGAISGNQYFAFNLSANAGYQLSLSGLGYTVRRSGTGPNMYIWQYSINGVNFFDIGADITNNNAVLDADVQPTLNLSSIPALQNVASGTTIYFRLYAWGATGAGGTFAIGRYGTGITTNSLEVLGTVSPVAVAPVLTAAPNSLAFGNVCVNTVSNAQSFLLNGTNLTGTTVAVGPFSGYQFATAVGGPYISSLSLPVAGGTIAQTVYVRFAPAVAGANNGTVVIQDNGLPTPTSVSPAFTVSGTGVQAAIAASASVNPVCVGASTTLNGAGGVSYVWSGPQPVTNGTAFNATLAHNGIYTVTGTDGNACTASSTISLTVNSIPTVTASASPNPVCNGGTTTLTGGGAATYTWTGGVTDGIAFTPAATGTYTVTGTSGAGCTSTSSVTVNVTPVPSPVTATPSSICIGGSSDLNAVSAGSNINWYTVPSGGVAIGTVASGVNFPVTPAITTTYYAENEGVGAPGGTQTFTFTGAMQTFTVPGGVTSIDIETWGAQGGANWVNNVNYGGYTKGTFNVTPGEVLNVYVGGKPATITGGFNGGGNGEGAGIGGGGASDVRQGGNTLADRIIVAGGAGGAGYWSNLHVVGGVGGGLTGGDGYRNTPADPGGQGGSQVASGTGTCITFNNPSVSGGFGFGGTPSGCGCEGYGGGGGWYGGAGSGNCRGGGGGSGYISPSATNPIMNSGVRIGNGEVVITWTASSCPSGRVPVTVTVNGLPTVTASPVTQTVCENGMATVSGGGAATYTWTGGITDATPFMVMAPATYTVTGTDGNGCTNTATAEVLMNAAPLVSASATPNTTCNMTSVTPNATGANSYVWSGGLTNGVPFVAMGTATYTVTGTNGAGCTATSTVTVTVNPASGVLAPATSNQSQDHGDDFNINYYDGSCDLIATVDDGAAGNILGLTTSTVNVDATAGFHNGQPFVRRWYQITPTSNGSADVILYINQSDFDDYNAAVVAPYLSLPTSGNNADPNVANIRITKNDNAGLGNNPVVITPTVNWNGTYWELSFNTPSFSQFRVHSVNPGNVPLPATVISFTGTKLESSDKLSWTTASEQNNAYFNLQHSTDGISFRTIAKVNSKAANGNSTSTLNYTSVNDKPALGHNYYRLQQVDIDQKVSVHAQIVDLIWGANGSSVSIYPNPTTDILNVDLYTAKAANTTVKLLDMSGRVVKQIQAKSVIGMNNIQLSMGEIAGGVYTIQVYENNTLTHTSKVRKNNN